MSLREDLERKVKQSRVDIQRNFDRVNDILEDQQQGWCHAAEAIKNVDEFIAQTDESFERATKLNKTDMLFLLFSTAMQCARQYLLTPFEARLTDKAAAKATLGHIEEHSDRIHRYYTPSLEEIVSNPVPFDAIVGGKDILTPTHRIATLGHDPVLGWLFGTANIATSTITFNNLESRHVKTNSGLKRDEIGTHADTGKVFAYAADKLLHQGATGKEIVATSLAKEAVHLRSDLKTKQSLPFPIVAVFNPSLTKTLSDYGVDMQNVFTVGKQAAFAVLINTLISMTHMLTYDPAVEYSYNLFSVRTRKILSYSNLIATSSNVLACAFAAVSGNPAGAEFARKYFDVGGLLVTIHRVVNDKKFIAEIKQEFLANEWYDYVLGK